MADTIIQNSLVHQLLKLEADREQVRKHYQSFELQIMAADSLNALIDLLINQSKEYFNLSSVSLWVVDRQYSLSELLDSEKLISYRNRLQIRHNEEFLSGLYGESVTVRLGKVPPLTANRLFPTLKTTASTALIPLMRHHQCVGSLHFASSDVNRFKEGKSADVLEHFARVVALCLENSINKEYLIRQSYRDLLTQVHNRLSFDEQLPKMISHAQRTQQPLSCAFIDVDHFKKINDQYGHQAGDICLKSIAAVINTQLRKADYLARFGGEEFVILLPNCPLDSALMIAERAREAVAVHQIETHKQQWISATISIGVASLEFEEESVFDVVAAEELLSRADEAMYQAKSQGRNCVVAHVV